jgi:hypothetical protein
VLADEDHFDRIPDPSSEIAGSGSDIELATFPLTLGNRYKTIARAKNVELVFF